jgi:DNA-binding transcriptional ArsR family regulator
MKPKSSADGIIDDAKMIAVLAAPVRTELATTLQALGGAATVAELAMRLGRSADGLYYHLRAMRSAGLLEEDSGPGGRRYRLATPGGQRVRLRYKPGATANARAIARVASSASRLAQRDFSRALQRLDTVVEGSARELWMARLTGWVDTSELKEINRLLRHLADLLVATRPTKNGKLIALQWILAPIDAKPLRRSRT